MSKKTVSYSQYTLYAQCPRRWKLDYKDGLRKYEQNINTCFGSAFHKTMQNYLEVLYNNSVKEANSIHLGDYLKQALFDEYKQSLAKNGNKHYSTPKQLAEFYEDGVAILNYFQKHRTAYFSTKGHKLVGIEVPLSIPLMHNVSFNGFIDIVIHDEINNRILIYDIKTSTMGWNKHQKADKTKTAQLILYKEFYAKQFGVDVESIDVEYIIVRRKINEHSEFNIKRIQLFAPASGKPTRTKIGKSFTDFIQSCFTEEGEYSDANEHLAIATSSCKYCPYDKNEELCPKKQRTKNV